MTAKLHHYETVEALRTIVSLHTRAVAEWGATSEIAQTLALEADRIRSKMPRTRVTGRASRPRPVR